MELCDYTLADYLYHTDTMIELRNGLTPFTDLPSTAKLQKIWDIMKQIASGVDFVHGNSMVHRDVKPCNSNSPTQCVCLCAVLYRDQWKLADFGLATHVKTDVISKSSGRRGTDGYRAPELLQSKLVDKEIDIWSMGCILYEMAFGKSLFKSDFEVMVYAIKKEPIQVYCDDLPYNSNTRDCICEFICSMVRLEPSMRPKSSVLVDQFTRHCQEAYCVSHECHQTLQSVFGNLNSDKEFLLSDQGLC